MSLCIYLFGCANKGSILVPIPPLYLFPFYVCALSFSAQTTLILSQHTAVEVCCSGNFHFSATPAAARQPIAPARPYMCTFTPLTLSDCLCFHASSTHLFLDWYWPKLPLTFCLCPGSTASLLSRSACGCVALRLFPLNSNSCLKVRILTQLSGTTVQPQWHQQWVYCVSPQPRSFVERSHMISVLSPDILKKTFLISSILTKTARN